MMPSQRLFFGQAKQGKTRHQLSLLMIMLQYKSGHQAVRFYGASSKTTGSLSMAKHPRQILWVSTLLKNIQTICLLAVLQVEAVRPRVSLRNRERISSRCSFCAASYSSYVVGLTFYFLKDSLLTILNALRDIKRNDTIAKYRQRDFTGYRPASKVSRNPYQRRYY